jgi:hypothetical protein
MGLFSSNKPKVTKDEFKKVCTDLYYKGWNHRELDLLRSFFDSSLNENREEERGLDAAEILQGVTQLRERDEIYHINEQKLKALEDVLKKYL